MRLPNFGYHFARWEGKYCRAAYRTFLPWIVKMPTHTKRTIPLQVFSYSGEESLPEQVRSIRSFLHYVGRPLSYTVVSDGTHLPESIRLLEEIHPTVLVRPASDFAPADLPSKLANFVRDHPMGKQLGLIMSLPTEGSALYLDSDILFFRGGLRLSSLLKNPESPNRYLADCRDCSLDTRLFRRDEEASDPVNMGVLLLTHTMDWSLSIQRYLESEGDATFFTNQTMTHLTMHAERAQAFDSSRYILQLDDQFTYRDNYRARDIVLRHYANPVRHKFWTTLLQ